MKFELGKFYTAVNGFKYRFDNSIPNPYDRSQRILVFTCNPDSTNFTVYRTEDGKCGDMSVDDITGPWVEPLMPMGLNVTDKERAAIEELLKDMRKDT